MHKLVILFNPIPPKLSSFSLLTTPYPSKTMTFIHSLCNNYQLRYVQILVCMTF